MIEIRLMTAADRDEVVEMMRIFYGSDAVMSNGSEEIFAADVDACTGENEAVEGYCFTEDGQVCGYAMIAKSFSTEFGRPCVWVEDLYLKPDFRRQGVSGQWFSFLTERYPDAVLRLEAESENKPALAAYEKSGFKELPYEEMIRFPK